jgi:hypothetical protein
VCGIVSAFILWRYEDESDNWEEMQIWLNRGLLGNWTHGDKGLPYPPSFGGMAHSGNDYLIARMGLRANIELEQESYLYPLLPIYRSGEALRKVTNKGRGGDIGVAHATRALYIVMKFPGYDEEVSDFEGMVRIAQKNEQGQCEIVTLSVTKGKFYPIISLTGQPANNSFFVQRGEPLAITIDDKDFKQNKVGKVEAYNEAQDKETGEKLGYYEILYKVGELFIISSHKLQIYYQLKYWHHGKTSKDKDGNAIENKPTILSYYYQD